MTNLITALGHALWMAFAMFWEMLSFMGQFLPVFLQFGLSAAKPTVQIAAARIENRIFA